jgi:hypothetical protein
LLQRNIFSLGIDWGATDTPSSEVPEAAACASAPAGATITALITIAHTAQQDASLPRVSQCGISQPDRRAIVVLKPAYQVSGSACALAGLLHRVVLVCGRVQLDDGLRLGYGPGAISFTDSVGSGKQVAAARLVLLAKLPLEMGGKNSLHRAGRRHLNVAVIWKANLARAACSSSR